MELAAMSFKILIIIILIALMAYFFLLFYPYSQYNSARVATVKFDNLSINRYRTTIFNVLSISSYFSYWPKVADSYEAEGDDVILFDHSSGGMMGQTAVRFYGKSRRVKDIRGGDIVVPGF